MFIAHLPAGYLATTGLRARLTGAPWRLLLPVGLVCSVLPDVDLLWFYLVDNRQTEHHAFIAHWPLFWVALAALLFILPWGRRRTAAQAMIGVGLTSLLLHMVLDSFAASIFWLAPFSDVHLNAVEVPARLDWGVWNFVFHWTFAIEIAICLAAIIVAARRPRLPAV